MTSIRKDNSWPGQFQSSMQMRTQCQQRSGRGREDGDRVPLNRRQLRCFGSSSTFWLAWARSNMWVNEPKGVWDWHHFIVCWGVAAAASNRVVLPRCNGHVASSDAIYRDNHRRTLIFKHYQTLNNPNSFMISDGQHMTTDCNILCRLQ